jgi:hypothetical protein
MPWNIEKAEHGILFCQGFMRTLTEMLSSVEGCALSLMAGIAR